jgi:DeoR/GlpR family transcriptional regulator of sugar metabolism
LTQIDKQMLKTERQNYILAQLKKKNKVTTFELAKQLQTSVDSIRRDLIELNNKGLLKKVYGGAFPIIEKRANVFDIVIANEDKKIKIGNKALSLLKDGQTIIISGGTTNLAFSKLIPADLKATIYTYSLPIAMQLSQHPNIDLIFIGGKLQKNAMVTIGLDVIQILSTIHADICFMGSSSLNVVNGLTETGYEVSIVKKAMLKAATKVVCMVTSEKLNTKNSHLVCDLSHLNTVITDLNPTDYILKEYVKSGILVL